MPESRHVSLAAARRSPRCAGGLARSGLAMCLLLACAATAIAAESPFAPGRSGPAELRLIDGVPVLIVAGTPEQIGRQKAELTATVLERLADYPVRLLALVGREGDSPKLVERARAQTVAANRGGAYAWGW